LAQDRSAWPKKYLNSSCSPEQFSADHWQIFNGFSKVFDGIKPLKAAAVGQNLINTCGLSHLNYLKIGIRKENNGLTDVYVLNKIT
jgi:hypothetical protein